LKRTGEDSHEAEQFTDEDEDDQTDSLMEESIELTEEERVANESRLRSFLERAMKTGRVLSDTSAKTLGVTVEKLTTAERDAFIEIVEDALREDEDAQLLIDD